MEYSGDPKTYMEGNVGNFRNVQGNPSQFGNPSSTSAFSAGTSRLGVFDLQDQQRRPHGSTGFDAGTYQALSGQPHHPAYALGNSHGLVPENGYGSLHMGAYDNSGIVDWNSNSRPLGVMESHYGMRQSGNGLFQAGPAGQSGWAPGLRAGQQVETLGLPIQQGYAIPELGQHPQQGSIVALNQQQHQLQAQHHQHQHQHHQQQQQQRGGGSNSRYTSSSQSSTSNRSFGSAGGGFNNPGTGGSNAQGRALNKMLLDILRDRTVDPNRLAMAIDANIERMDCVNLATLLFHTGKKRLLLTPSFIKRIALRFGNLKEELRAREASNALYGLKCMSSECPEVRQLVFALASKVAVSQTELVAQAVGNALYGCQMMTSEHEEVRYLLQVVASKIGQCTELLEAQNVGNALYGLRGMNSDCKEVRAVVAALTPKVATAREELNGQALGNSLYGLQGMSSREIEVRNLLSVLAIKVSRTWEDLKAQEVGNALYGLKRMNSDVAEVRTLIDSLVPKVSSSPEILDAQAIGNSFYGMQNMKSDNPAVRTLLSTMAEKVMLSPAELDGQAMGNSLYGLQGMDSDYPEVRAVVNAITMKVQASGLEMNAQELGNALYGLQRMSSAYPETRRLMLALANKVASSKHELTSQEIGNAIFGLQGMRSEVRETRVLVRQMAAKISQSSSLIDPQGIANSLFGIQRMSSDYEEVRLLVAALAVKIEQSWKLLGAQHISNGIFGLQSLCSVEPESRLLVHALVPKVLASRDEMSPKQICNALYGLKNMFSSHDEIRLLLGPLTEKLNLCADPIPLQQLAAAFYSLQGIDNDTEEARALLIGLCDKLAMVDEIDAFSIGNSIFGLQRMNTNCQEMQTTLELLSPMVVALADSGLEISARVCSNILFGLQNCSCAEESVRRILFVVIARMKTLIMQYETSKGGGVATGGAPSSNAAGSTTTTSFVDLLLLFQSLAVASMTFPDSHLDMELQEEVQQLRMQLGAIVESRKETELLPCQVSPLQRRLAEATSDVFLDSPFEVVCGELLHGFESSVVVRLKPSAPMLTEDGEEWNPVLNMEVAGIGSKFPAKELFVRLRAEYLHRQFGVTVQVLSMNAIAGLSRSALRDFLRRTPDIFASLYHTPEQFASNFPSILTSMSLSLHPAGRARGDAGGSFFSMGAGDVLVGGSPEFPDPHEDDSVDVYDGQSLGRRPPIGLPIGWIGDTPVVTITMMSPSSTPVAQYSSPTAHLIAATLAQRRPGQSIFTVQSSAMPPGYSSRIVSPPFVQIGPAASSMAGMAGIAGLSSGGGSGAAFGGVPSLPTSAAVPSLSGKGAAGPAANPGMNGNALAGMLTAPVKSALVAYNNPMQSRGSAAAIATATATAALESPDPLDMVSLSGHSLLEPLAHVLTGPAAARRTQPAVTLIGPPSVGPTPLTGTVPQVTATPIPVVGAALSATHTQPLPAYFSPTSAATAVAIADGAATELATNAADDESENGISAGEASEVDSEIALLEAQLEIKRMEARLLMLKKVKSVQPPGLEK